MKAYFQISLYKEFSFTKKKKYLKYQTELNTIFNNFNNVGNVS